MTTRAKILLVDDHPEDLEALDGRLRALGYQTLLALDGVKIGRAHV